MIVPDVLHDATGPVSGGSLPTPSHSALASAQDDLRLNEERFRRLFQD